MKVDELLKRLVETAEAYNDGVEAEVGEDDLHKLLMEYNFALEDARQYLSKDKFLCRAVKDQCHTQCADCNHVEKVLATN